MPYILISTQIRLETGPTMVGDEYSDPSIMNYLGARKTTILGNNFSEYHVDEPPRLVLDKLDKIGYRVVSMTGSDRHWFGVFIKRPVTRCDTNVSCTSGI